MHPSVHRGCGRKAKCGMRLPSRGCSRKVQVGSWDPHSSLNLNEHIRLNALGHTKRHINTVGCNDWWDAFVYRARWEHQGKLNVSSNRSWHYRASTVQTGLKGCLDISRHLCGGKLFGWQEQLYRRAKYIVVNSQDISSRGGRAEWWGNPPDKTPALKDDIRMLITKLLDLNSWNECIDLFIQWAFAEWAPRLWQKLF